jgi:translation elongation factor EF-G
MVEACLRKRRGHVTDQAPLYGTPLYTMTATLPVIESFGFETDVRIVSRGTSFPQAVFGCHEAIPGSTVLDRSVPLPVLER